MMKMFCSIRSTLAILLATVMIFTLACSTAFANSTPELPFTDIEADAWYTEYVKYVYENGLMQGKGEGSFAPKAGMTRAEMATLLSRMAEGNTEGLEENAKQFSDIDGTEWHAEYIGWAVEEGLLNGYNDGTMKPNQPVLRQEIVTIFSRFADSFGLTLPSDTEVPEFEDAEEIAPYAVPYVNKLASAGIIEGSNGKFNPKKSLTRAEASKIIKMFHELMCEIPEDESGFVPVLRFVVASDIHIKDSNTVELTRFENLFDSAYRYAESNRKYKTLDAVVLVGDLTDNGMLTEYMRMKKVIDAKLKDETEILAVTGNHDVREDPNVTTFPRYFDNDPNFNVVIKGFHFIGISNRIWEKLSEEGIEKMSKAVDEATASDPEKPIFTFQHYNVGDTVLASGSTRDENSVTLHEIYSRHSQVVNFSGHTHVPINLPTSIWQGEYTALTTGSMSYIALSGMSNGAVPEGGRDAAQYYIVEVDANNSVRILPYNLATDSFFSTPSNTDAEDEQLIYYIENPTDKSTFTYTDDREATAEKPYFEAEAKLEVTNIGAEGATLTIPSAKDSQALYSYEIEYSSEEGGKKIVYTSGVYKDPMPLIQTYNLDKLKADTKYTVSVTPVNIFMIKGDPLTVEFTTAKE